MQFSKNVPAVSNCIAFWRLCNCRPAFEIFSAKWGKRGWAWTAELGRPGQVRWSELPQATSARSDHGSAQPRGPVWPRAQDG